MNPALAERHSRRWPLVAWLMGPELEVILDPMVSIYSPQQRSSKRDADLWKAIDEVIVGVGFGSLWDKFKLPAWFMMAVAYACAALQWLTGVRLKLNPFAVRMLTMHRWFNIDKATKDLGYEPIIPFEQGWRDTTTWFRENWLPSFNKRAGLRGLSKQTQNKIDLQAEEGGQAAKKTD